MGNTFAIIAIIIALILWWLYHKVFQVVYFNAGKGCLFEILTCLLIGTALAAIIMKYWIFSIPVILIIIAIVMKQKKND